MDSKLYVGNLSQHTTEEDLRMLFARVGFVVSVNLVKDRSTGKSKGFAFVEMISQADAGKAASEYNGFLLDHRNISVKAARQPEQPAGRMNGYTEYKSYNESIRGSSSSARQRNSRPY